MRSSVCGWWLKLFPQLLCNRTYKCLYGEFVIDFAHFRRKTKMPRDQRIFTKNNMYLLSPKSDRKNHNVYKRYLAANKFLKITITNQARGRADHIYVYI